MATGLTCGGAIGRPLTWSLPDRAALRRNLRLDVASLFLHQNQFQPFGNADNIPVAQNWMSRALLY